MPSFRDISREIRNISPASAYHASVTGSHLGNELSNVSDSSVLEHSTSAGRGEIHKVQQEVRSAAGLRAPAAATVQDACACCKFVRC